MLSVQVKPWVSGMNTISTKTMNRVGPGYHVRSQVEYICGEVWAQSRICWKDEDVLRARSVVSTLDCTSVIVLLLLCILSR